MKIRNGFVSNSSSSSFVILGFEMSNLNAADIYKKMLNLSHDDLINKIHEKEKIKKEDIDEPLIYDFCLDGIYDFCMDETHNFNFSKNGLDVFFDDGDIYIGIILGEGDDCGHIPFGTLMFSDVHKSLIEISEKFNLNIEDAKIFSGTKMC